VALLALLPYDAAESSSPVDHAAVLLLPLLLVLLPALDLCSLYLTAGLSADDMSTFGSVSGSNLRLHSGHAASHACRNPQDTRDDHL
jgi:hypothetical protein